jgi:hypothetical protein
MKYITNASAIILILNDNTNVRVEKTDKNYAKVLKTFELEADKQDDAVRAILNPVILGKKAVTATKGFQLINDQIFYQGEQLPAALEKKVLSIMADGLPLTHFEKLWENIIQNPACHVVNESGFYDFLDYKELPITEDGCFLALSGSRSTKVLQGTVNERGQIYNGVGEVIEVQRRGVSDDRNVHCHEGSLHIGSLDYAQGWARKLIIVKVNPKDVVSVPNDCGCQKCRVCKYEVVGDFVGEIKAPVTDDAGVALPDTAQSEYADLAERVDIFIQSKIDEGASEVTLRQIQNSLSPDWISRDRLLNILHDSWYDFGFDEYLGVDVVWL